MGQEYFFVAPEGTIAAVKFSVEKLVKIIKLIYLVLRGDVSKEVNAVILDSNQRIIFSKRFK